MADGFKNLVAGGQRYVPQSSDPSNPKEGDYFHSDGTSRAEGLWVYKNGGWAQVGSGNGDLSVYKQFDAEDGDLTGFSNVAISSSSPLAGDNSYTVSTFPATFASISLDERHKNKTHSMECHYKLTSGSAKLVVKDNSSNVLEELVVSSTDSEKAILTFYVAPAVTSVQLEVQDDSSATGFKIDDVIFSDDPFVYKNIQEENVFSARIANNGTASVLSESFPFIESVNRSALGIVDVVFVSGFFTEIPSVIAESHRITNASQITINNVSVSGCQIRSLGTGGSGGFDADFDFIVQRQGDDYKQPTEHVITPATSGTEYYSINPQTSNFWDGTGTQDTFNTSLIPLTGSTLIEWEDVAETRLKAIKDCIVDVSVTASSSGAGSNITINDSSGTNIAVGPTYTNTYISNAQAEVKLSAGDYISFRQSSLLNRNGGLRISARPAKAEFLAAVPTQLTAILEHREPNNTAGGDYTTGSWQFRDLNEIHPNSDSGFVTLGSNGEFTLPSGKYLLSYWGQNYAIGANKCRLYDVTGASATDIVGSGAATTSTGNYQSMDGVLDISSSKTYKVEVRGTASRATQGMGFPSNFGEDEVYAQVKITKLS